MKYLAVGAAGFFGAITRYAVSRLAYGLAGTGFPWGTLTVNLTGSFLIGLVYAVSAERLVEVDAFWRTVVAVGFIGSYTTFSTFSLETLNLIEAGSWSVAGAYAAGSVFLGLLAVLAGGAVGRLV